MDSISGGRGTQLGELQKNGDDDSNGDQSNWRKTGKPSSTSLKNQSYSSSSENEEKGSDASMDEDRAEESLTRVARKRKITREESRLEVNRVKARERRKKKKEVWQEMQKQLVHLTEDNKNLRQRNELLSAEITRINQTSGRVELGSSAVAPAQQNVLQQVGAHHLQNLIEQQSGGVTAAAGTSIAAGLGATQSAVTSGAAARVLAGLQRQAANIASSASSAGLGASNINASANSHHLQTLLGSIQHAQQPRAVDLANQGNNQTIDGRGIQMALRDLIQRQQLNELLQQAASGSQQGQRK